MHAVTVAPSGSQIGSGDISKNQTWDGSDFEGTGAGAFGWDKTDAQVYAYWTPVQTLVAIDCADGNFQNDLLFTFDAVPSFVPQFPTRTGYTLQGFTTEPDGAGRKLFNADGSYAPEGAWDYDAKTMTIYAHWKGNSYKCHLDVDGETNTVEVVFGGTPADVTPPSKDYYVFDGFYDADGNKVIGADGKHLGSWSFAADTTLIAMWQELPESLEPVAVKAHWPWNAKYDITYEAINLKPTKKYLLSAVFKIDDREYTATVALPSVNGTNTIEAAANDAGKGEVFEMDAPMHLRLLLDKSTGKED